MIFCWTRASILGFPSQQIEGLRRIACHLASQGSSGTRRDAVSGSRLDIVWLNAFKRLAYPRKVGCCHVVSLLAHRKCAIAAIARRLARMSIWRSAAPPWLRGSFERRGSAWGSGVPSSTSECSCSAVSHPAQSQPCHRHMVASSSGLSAASVGGKFPIGCSRTVSSAFPLSQFLYCVESLFHVVVSLCSESPPIRTHCWIRPRSSLDLCLLSCARRSPTNPNIIRFWGGARRGPRTPRHVIEYAH